MRTRGQEYLLADLLEEPALSLAIERGGFDSRSLARVLRIETCGDRRRPAVPEAGQPFAFIAE
jgi:hypothetical protein